MISAMILLIGMAGMAIRVAGWIATLPRSACETPPPGAEPPRRPHPQRRPWPVL